MTKLSLHWENLKNVMFKKFGPNPGTAIMAATALGVATSSIAQSMAIAYNKKIVDKEKKFLIPQELLDGAINVAASVLIIGTMSKCAGRLVETGKWSTDGIRELIAKLPETVKVKMGDPETNLVNIFFEHAAPKDNENFKTIYYKFKWGMEMLSSAIGSVLALSVAAPFIRNYAAAKFQQAHLKKQQDNNQTVATVNAIPVQKPIATNYHNYTMTAITSPTSSLKI